MGFAVVDVETTGFAAGRDRIIEVAVVQADASGAVTDEWCTLVNPHRDLGAQHVHRISAREVLPAPTFDRIAGDLVARLTGRVLVAHNLTFDARFLHAELANAGLPLPAVATEGVCTMTLAPRYLSTDRRNLAACCAAAGIPLTNAHSALHDARATAALLAHYLSAGEGDWAQLIAAARARSWPFVPALDTPAVHRGAPGHPVARRPRRADAPAYRQSRRTSAYYRARHAPDSFVPAPAAEPAPLPAGFRLDPGDRIAFTGQTDQPRELLQAHASAAGLITHPENVCRWTKVVVAADPDSLSAKARKARDYRIPIITEPVFAQLLDELRTPR
ncbi:exonuclease domain-containing protein [Crossiella sp. CA-258035]|uniref:exonuclease domain-containing protein n=1 Tax=Crossiella sp. CA-258035 TaxID=2981138 RepID=UPI0024BCD70A|nr:exonuclease domain-containing protein [Crossiella sp. CA-258035]WHT15902.1 exonuclease domain-containing protein [Crossiella sp. CA-258035]